MRNLIIVFTSLGLIASSSPSLAATRWHDAKGKFVKCAKAAPVKMARCRNDKGHFQKCGTPGAKPA